MKCTFILTGIAMLCFAQSQAQKLWSGNGNNNQWTNPANWVGNAVPSSGDSVLLNNSIFAGSYAVSLPSGTTAYAVKKIRIAPLAGNTIQFIIPSTNLAAPAFAATGPGYGVIIENGGIFKNSSGLASGISLVVADSIRINNGGRYIHNTRTVHATNIVQLLSKASGTESGTFEFDIPSGTGTLSMSNRIYGNLVLSSSAAEGNRTYTCSGSNALTINGDLIINPGVTLSVDLATANGNIILKGNLIQNGGIVNLASGAGNSTVLKVAGNITQMTSGQITESNTGLPAIELNGTAVQNISLAGTIVNDISFIMNNPSGAVLLSSLSLPYKLILKNGQLSTSAASSLTLQNTCTLQADTLSASFINGPLKKTGLASANRFLFPVGKNNMHRWLELKDATGNFTVEYHRDNPYSLSPATANNIHHISGLEYWTIKADASPAASAIVRLSFDNINSGGVTDLSKLLIARLSAGIWTGIGGISQTGSAATNGSVTAAIATTNFTSAGNDFFTLTTDISSANPLPIEDVMMLPEHSPQHTILYTRLLYATPSVLTGNTTTLALLSAKEEQIKIIITNLMGQRLGIQNFYLSKGYNRLNINFLGLSYGVYQLTGYTTSARTNTIRCIKQ